MVPIPKCILWMGSACNWHHALFKISHFWHNLETLIYSYTVSWCYLPAWAQQYWKINNDAFSSRDSKLRLRWVSSHHQCQCFKQGVLVVLYLCQAFVVLPYTAYAWWTVLFPITVLYVTFSLWAVVNWNKKLALYFLWSFEIWHVSCIPLLQPLLRYRQLLANLKLFTPLYIVIIYNNLHASSLSLGIDHWVSDMQHLFCNLSGLKGPNSLLPKLQRSVDLHCVCDLSFLLGLSFCKLGL